MGDLLQAHAHSGIESAVFIQNSSLADLLRSNVFIQNATMSDLLRSNVFIQNATVRDLLFNHAMQQELVAVSHGDVVHSVRGEGWLMSVALLVSGIALTLLFIYLLKKSNIKKVIKMDAEYGATDCEQSPLITPLEIADNMV